MLAVLSAELSAAPHVSPPVGNVLEQQQRPTMVGRTNGPGSKLSVISMVLAHRYKRYRQAIAAVLAINKNDI